MGILRGVGYQGFMIRARLFLILLAAAIACVGNLPAAAANEHVVNAAFKAPSVDLLPVLKLVKSPTPRAVIELPPDANGSKRLMSLQARRPGDDHSWVVFSLKNPELQPQALVLTIPRQGFAGSGVFNIVPDGSLIAGIQASQAQPAVRLAGDSSDSYALTVAPGDSVTYAIELPGETIKGVRLWRRADFDARARHFSFFRGVVFGIAMLLAIGFICLFIVRPLLVFPSAALFAWSAILFTFLNLGPLPGWLLAFQDLVTAPGLRALTEGLMMTGAAALFVSLLQLRHRSGILFMVFVLAALAGLAIAVTGLYKPALALTAARLGFAGVVLTGTAVVFYLWQRGVESALSALLPSVLLLAWTVVAAVTCLQLIDSGYLLPTLAAGLVLVLVTMGFVLVQTAFGQASGARYFHDDSGRRALALAGSELAVWDWQLVEDDLHIGQEVARALGWPPGTLDDQDTRSWLEFIHPADRVSYKAAIESALRRGRGTFGQDFRLRRADGAYRWYQLRARAIAGSSGPSRMIGTLADVTAQKRAQESLLSDAVHDRVTGLPNKALFMDRLRAAMSLARPAAAVHIIIVDLDRFKAVNDGLGHEIGDSLLNVTARRIAQFMSPVDTVARLPGDQFAVLLHPDAPPGDVAALCERLRDTLAEPVNLRPREVFVTASIGVAGQSNAMQRPEDLLKDAEIALYEAKRLGRNQVVFFSPRMREETVALAVREQDLQGALERSELVVYYQPIMRVADGQLAGFEALVRWQHPNGELLDAGSFVPLAEQSGQIKAIGHFVLHEATRQLGIWQRAFRPSDPLFVSVNVASEQLLDFALVKDIRSILTREGVRPETLKLELTESMLMQNPELAIQLLQQIKDQGVSVACDDFGTGYSALAHLRRLPFDTLKLDEAFINHEGDSDRNSIIVESIVLMAHDLDLQVIAEGVENPDQLEQLRAFDCDFAQGFFVGVPVSAQQVIAALGSVPYSQAGTGANAGQAIWDMLRGAPPPPQYTPDLPETVTRRPEPERDPAPARPASAPARPSPPASTATEAASVPRPRMPEEPEADSIWPEDEHLKRTARPAVPFSFADDELPADDQETGSAAAVSQDAGQSGAPEQGDDADDAPSPARAEQAEAPKHERPADTRRKARKSEKQPAAAEKPQDETEPEESVSKTPSDKAEEDGDQDSSDADANADAKTERKTSDDDSSKTAKPRQEKDPDAAASKTGSERKAARVSRPKKRPSQSGARLATKLRRAAKSRATKKKPR